MKINFYSHYFELLIGHISSVMYLFYSCTAVELLDVGGPTQCLLSANYLLIPLLTFE